MYQEVEKNTIFVNCNNKTKQRSHKAKVQAVITHDVYAESSHNVQKCDK